MAKKTKVIENSEAEIESAMLNEMDEIGAGDIPADVLEQSKEEEKKEEE